jgi:AcrR family transcriptional regulator
MKWPSEEAQPAGGWRERKKAKTRAAIRRNALRLFREQGYAATTVEQIAQAAEVSPATFFRYFPTKEDVVLRDDYDPLLFAAFKAQPTDLTPIQALRGAMRAVFTALPAEELDQERERFALISAIPELRAKILEEFVRTIQVIAEVLAERIGRRPDDFAVRTFAGALIGVAMATMVAAIDDPDADYWELLDIALTHLEAGLPL